MLTRLEERLNILHHNEALEDKWEELRTLGNQYRELEKELLEPRFLRIHRSYLINMDNVERVGANYVTIDNKQIPMNDSSKAILKQHLNL